MTRGAGTLEVAHEALLRREPIAGWLDAQKDDLRLRDNVLKEAEDWEGRGAYGRVRHAEGLVRRGERLQRALALLATPDFTTALAPAKDYILACQQQEATAKRGARRTQRAIYTLLLGIIAGLVGLMNQAFIVEQIFKVRHVYPYVLTVAKERALKPLGPPFKECSDCPEMLVVPSGEFLMGSSEGQGGGDERPQHKVTIAKQYAVGKYDVTFDEWDRCFALGGCKNPASDSSWDRGRRPAITVSWHDAQEYVAWLSKLTGQPYRLLTEAEWEYAARAGTTTTYSFGDDKKALGDYAWYAENSESKTHPVGEKKPNSWGLSDMHGNVLQWVEDAHHGDYKDAPTDGSEWKSEDKSSSRVLRGGSWYLSPNYLRSAIRFNILPDYRTYYVGFRVARTLLPPTP